MKDGDDAEAIKAASEELSKAGQAVGMKMYQQEAESAKAAEGAGGAEEKKEDGAVEGEVVDESTEEEPNA